MHLALPGRAALARPFLASPLHAPFPMRSLGQILSLRRRSGGATARGERAACGSEERAAQASGAGREGGRARRGLSFRLTDLLLLAALTFVGFHFLIDPMRAASGLSADDIVRSGPHVTAVCALSVILVTRVGMFAGLVLAQLFGGKGVASLCTAFGCVLCAWSLLYGAGSKGVHECFGKDETGDLQLVDPVFGNTEPVSAPPPPWQFQGWITPE